MRPPSKAVALCAVHSVSEYMDMMLACPWFILETHIFQSHHEVAVDHPGNLNKCAHLNNCNRFSGSRYILNSNLSDSDIWQFRIYATIGIRCVLNYNVSDFDILTCKIYAIIVNRFFRLWQAQQRVKPEVCGTAPRHDTEACIKIYFQCRGPPREGGPPSRRRDVGGARRTATPQKHEPNQTH